jgi:hypothetical protein
MISYSRILLRLHLLNLRDGSPYRATPSNVIHWASQIQLHGVHVMKMTASRVMIFLELESEWGPRPHVMLVWNWETGELVRKLQPWSHFSHLPFQVFDCSNTGGSRLTGGYHHVEFLDEFRIIAASTETFADAPELFVFNTLIPQGRPKNVRRLELPPKYQHRHCNLYLDDDRSLGKFNRDGPLIVDPTHSIVLLELASCHQQSIFLILRAQSLIECACSMRTDDQMPWDECRRGAVDMKTLVDCDPCLGGVAIHGSRVLMFLRDYRGTCYTLVHDFGPRGNGAPLSLDGNGGGTVRVAVSEDDPDSYFGETLSASPWRTQSLGGSVAIFVVNSFPPLEKTP